MTSTTSRRAVLAGAASLPALAGPTIACAPDPIFALIEQQREAEPMQPRSLMRAWQMAIGKIKLPRVRFHDLRHAHATHLLSSGVHPKVASERLGHSRVAITLDLYSHVLPGMQEDAALRVDDALRLAIQKRASKSIR